MSAKRLAILIVPVLVAILCVVPSAWAQKNDLSVTAGRTFVSTETVPSSGYPVHFGNPASFEVDYGRLLITKKIFGLTAEVPVAVYPHMDLNYYPGGIPRNIGAVFVTPSLRLNIFSGDSVTPWISVGGGYGRFRESSSLYYYGTNPGPTGTNTGVVQFGAGLDVWFWSTWGARFEARDFFSGDPALDVTTDVTRQHNYYVGVGVMHRF